LKPNIAPCCSNRVVQSQVILVQVDRRIERVLAVPTPVM
jgi:hypothetical protein